jgi:hypothetical protein
VIALKGFDGVPSIMSLTDNSASGLLYFHAVISIRVMALASRRPFRLFSSYQFLCST